MLSISSWPKLSFQYNLKHHGVSHLVITPLWQRFKYFHIFARRLQSNTGRFGLNWNKMYEITFLCSKVLQFPMASSYFADISEEPNIQISTLTHSSVFPKKIKCKCFPLQSLSVTIPMFLSKTIEKSHITYLIFHLKFAQTKFDETN